jgi:hypothetical protein
LSRALLVSSLLALGALAWPRFAAACSPVEPRWPRLAEPLFEDPAVDITSEHLDLDCRPHERDAACAFTITLRVRNTSSAAVETLAVLPASDLIRTVDVMAPGPLPVVVVDASRFVGAAPVHGQLRELVHRALAFRLSLGGSEAREVSIKTAFVMERFVDPCYEEGVQVRHAMFFAGQRGGEFALVYYHSNTRHRLSRDRISVHTRRPVG